MDYHEWAAAYEQDACRIKKVIEKKKSQLTDKKLNADARKSISDTISAYRSIYRELVRTADHLRARGGQTHEA